MSLQRVQAEHMTYFCREKSSAKNSSGTARIACTRPSPAMCCDCPAVSKQGHQGRANQHHRLGKRVHKILQLVRTTCRTPEEALRNAPHILYRRLILAWDEILRIHTRHKLAAPGSFKARKAAGKALFVQIEVLRPHIWQQARWQWRNYKGKLHICEPHEWYSGADVACEAADDFARSPEQSMHLEGGAEEITLLEGPAHSTDALQRR